MIIEIKHRYTKNVLFACDAENMRGAVIRAVKSGPTCTVPTCPVPTCPVPIMQN